MSARTEVSSSSVRRAITGRRIVVCMILALVLIPAGFCIARRPSNDRAWTPDQSRLPSAEFRGDLVVVRNVRNFRYESTDRYEPAWEDRTYDLRRLESLWFVVEPFGWEPAAHTFVSFGFSDGRYLAISVEIRKEQGESFSALRGLAREYEIMYVAGDERDLIELRAIHRRDDVYLYRVRATGEAMRAMLLEMLTRANRLRTHPEFYNTATNTCTSNLVRHANRIAPRRIPWSLGIFFPGYSDRLAYRLELIDTSMSFDELRRRSKVNDVVSRHAGDPRFPVLIRKGLP